jgi:hypothetical protein
MRMNCVIESLELQSALPMKCLPVPDKTNIQVEIIWVVMPCSVAVRGLEDGGSKVPRKLGIPPQRYTLSQPSEDGGSRVLRNVGIPLQRFMASQPRDLDLKHHRHENVESLKLNIVLMYVVLLMWNILRSEHVRNFVRSSVRKRINTLIMLYG